MSYCGRSQGLGANCVGGAGRFAFSIDGVAGDCGAANGGGTGFECALGAFRRIPMWRRRCACERRGRGRSFLIFVSKSFHKIPFEITR